MAIYFVAKKFFHFFVHEKYIPMFVNDIHSERNGF